MQYLPQHVRKNMQARFGGEEFRGFGADKEVDNVVAALERGKSMFEFMEALGGLKIALYKKGFINEANIVFQIGESLEGNPGLS